MILSVSRRTDIPNYYSAWFFNRIQEGFVYVKKWRYDPIIFTKKYTPEYHLKTFGQIAAALKGYTKKCVVSFKAEQDALNT